MPDNAYGYPSVVVEPAPTPAELRKAEVKRLKDRLRILKELEQAEKFAERCRWWLANNN